jgi:2'-5' RNA ligase
MKRTFIAVKIEPEEDFRDAITFIRSELRFEIIRWVDINNLHITLAFIGDTEDNVINKVVSMLKNELSGFGELVFTLSGIGLFRSINDPRIIRTGIENGGRLADVREIIKNGLGLLDIKLEERKFKPHVTLGRIKDIRDINNLQRLVQKYSGVVLQTVKVSEIIFYESVLLPTGPLYKPIAGVGLER